MRSCTVYAPGADMIMYKANALVYDDAPWLSSSVAGRMKVGV